MSFSTKLPDSSAVTNSSFSHIPVLNRELIDGLAVRSGGHYLDATVGGGGHSSSILAIAADVQITAIDRDAQALKAAQARLQVHGDLPTARSSASFRPESFGERDSAELIVEASAEPSSSVRPSSRRGPKGSLEPLDERAASPEENRVHFWRGNFADYDPGENQFDGILADLGVSSAQFDQPERGFSFRYEAPLDMRMDQQQSLTAADLVNQAPEAELAHIFYTYGEERFSRRIARRIVAQRPFHTTTELAAAIAQALPYPSRNGKSAGKSRRRPIHPATRVFQALRIAVNQELVSLETFLNRAPNWLKPYGRIGVISFHSLEDRIVKHALRASPELHILTKKPILPQADEAAGNPRSRSAKLRLAERLS